MSSQVKSKLVFSNGKWTHVRIPSNTDPSWLSSDIWYYATIYAAAITVVGADEKRAKIIAEASVNKRIYKDLVYDSALEADIAKVFF